MACRADVFGQNSSIYSMVPSWMKKLRERWGKLETLPHLSQFSPFWASNMAVFQQKFVESHFQRALIKKHLLCGFCGLCGLCPFYPRKGNKKTVTYFCIFFSVDQQLGCFMGFSITACVISGIMFICYCLAVDYFATVLRCRNYSYYSSYGNVFCYSLTTRNNASVGAGVGSVLLILSLVEWFVALASSIYCCNATSCCGTPTVSCVS